MSCCVTWARGDAAADLYNKGITELNNNQFADAAKDFQTIITSYPTFQQIDEAHLQAGHAYFNAKNYSAAISALQKEAAPGAKPDYHAEGLFFTGLSQFYAGQDKTTAGHVDSSDFRSAILTFNSLTDFISQNPTPDNKGFLEQAVYFRALGNYKLSAYDATIKDLLALTTDPQFSQSLSRPDYLLLLGQVYSIQASNALSEKKPDPDTVNALAGKALSTLDEVTSDPNALVQANDANMAKGEVYLMLAGINNNSSDDYQKALDAYHQVRRKADLLQAQTTRLEQLRVQSQQFAQQNAVNHAGSGFNPYTPIIGREQGKLDELKSPDTPDPIIDALIGTAECYINITGPDGKKESDEARTVLHRLVAHAKLTPDQQKKVDFNILFSYVLGGETDKAGKALDDYLAKHRGDPGASSISILIGQELFKRKNYDGALASAKRSIQDFPTGPNVADAYTLEARALTALNRIPESRAVIDEFLQKNPTSPQAYAMVLTRATNEVADNDLTSALADFGKVKDAAAAGPETQASAHASYIQTLSKLNKVDNVIAEAKIFEAKYPTSKALSAVLLFAAEALETKNDPGAIPALQDIARKFPDDTVITPIALYSVVAAYARTGNLTLMLAAAKDLQSKCPQAYPQILQAADTVSALLEKQKPPRFDDAAALYQPLTQASDPAIASSAQNKLGDVRLAQAKSYHYLSLPPAGTPGVTVTRADAEKALAAAQSAYEATLKNFPGQLGAVGDALTGLLNVAQRNRSWNLFKDDSAYETFFTTIGQDLPSAEMQARLEMAKAGLVFVIKNGAAQYPAALDRYRKVLAANPGITLTSQETDQYGELLLAAKDYPTAQKVYEDFLENGAGNDPAALAIGYYGLGSVAFAQNDSATALKYFTKLKALPGGAPWFKHINDASYDLAYLQEQSGTPADVASAKATYSQLMRSMAAGPIIQTQALLGYGRILEKEGYALPSKPAPQGPTEYAIHYYLQPSLMFFTATPEQSAWGLYLAGQAYDKAGDKANAKLQYDAILTGYKTVAPDWAAKAQAAEGQ